MVPKYKGSATSRSSDQELKEKIVQVWFILVNSVEFMPILANFTALNLSNIMGSMTGRSTTYPTGDGAIKVRADSNDNLAFHNAVSGHFVNEDIKTLTKAYKIGTVILFHRNISTTVRLIQPTAPFQDLV